MIRFIAHLLILFILFTHSTIAMDVQIQQSTNLTNNTTSTLSQLPTPPLHTQSNIADSFNPDQVYCDDIDGHCTHHQAHTAGLVTVYLFSNLDIPQAFIPCLKLSALIYTQSPLLRPPKS